MIDILNLALPYFGLIFIGFACGKAKALPEDGLAWMNFFLLYVSLPALLFGIMAKTPFAELNNPPFLIATTFGTASAFFLAMFSSQLIGRLSVRESTLAGLAGGYGNIGYMGPGLALAVLGSKAAAPTALIFCCDAIFLFYDRAAVDRAHRPRTPVAAAHARHGGAADRPEPLDHVGLRRRARRRASTFARRSRSTIRCCSCRTPPRRWRCSCSG